MLSPTTLLNTLTLKVMLNLKSCQINEDKIFIEKTDLDQNRNLDTILFKLGFNEIIVGSDNDLQIIKPSKMKTRNKRTRDDEDDYFHYKHWISPTRIRNYLEEPFSCLMTEVSDLRPFDDPPNEFTLLYMNRGKEFEKFMLELFEKKKIIISKVVDGVTLPNYQQFRETISLMSSGCPIIYQALLLDGENKIFGCPDFLIRSDYLIKMFPKMNFKFKVEKSRLNQPYYVIVDIKFKTLEFNNSGFSWNQENRLNISQMYLYQNILNKIQGEFNYAFLCGKRCKNKNLELVLDGKDYLAEIDFTHKSMPALKEEINFAINEIRILRDLPVRFTLENLPERYLPDFNNRKFSKIKEYYRKEILKEKPTNTYDLSKSKDIVKKIPNDKLMIYLDFETLDLDILLPMEELGNDYNAIFLFQIGYYVPELNKYCSLIAENIDKVSEENILKTFISQIEELEKQFNKKAVFVIYSCFESVNYNKLSQEHDIPQIEFLDIYKILRDNKFKKAGQYKLKTLSRELKEYYPEDFKIDFTESEIEVGFDAMRFGYEYYKTRSQQILNAIEFYNKLDVVFLYELVSFLEKNSKITHVNSE